MIKSCHLYQDDMLVLSEKFSHPVKPTILCLHVGPKEEGYPLCFTHLTSKHMLMIACRSELLLYGCLVGDNLCDRYKCAAVPEVVVVLRSFRLLVMTV